MLWSLSRFFKSMLHSLPRKVFPWWLSCCIHNAAGHCLSWGKSTWSTIPSMTCRKRGGTMFMTGVERSWDSRSRDSIILYSYSVWSHYHCQTATCCNFEKRNPLLSMSISSSLSGLTWLKHLSPPKVLIMTHHVPQYIVGHDMFLVGSRNNGNHWTITQSKWLSSVTYDCSKVTEPEILSI